MAKSDEHIYRCVDIIRNDKTLSEQTIILMFLVYKDLILNERGTPSNVDKTKSRGH
jgi:hypothetical protein